MARVPRVIKFIPAQGEDPIILQHRREARKKALIGGLIILSSVTSLILFLIWML